VGAPDGERKSITALFADIKGSTDLIQDLDPEDARAILDPALQTMMDAVHRYEGYVAQALGDGIFALFGAPIAHEDHPQRALYAALLMQEESRKHAEHLRRDKGLNLQIRVGVNTGEVVLRSIRKDDLHTDYVPVGHSTHLAARMEQLATPGAIVVSEYTQKLTEGYFDFKPLGPAHIKGFPEPIHTYEVVGVGPLRTKLQVAARRGLARFVGRQSEMEQLRRALEMAKAGHGQIVGVMGEPGVGKSRLFYEFVGVRRTVPLHTHGCLILETFSVSHGKAYPYLPLIDLLKNYFQLGLHDDERVRREKITGQVLTLARSLEDILPYFFFLLGIAEPTLPLQQMDPQIRRRRILEAIKRLLLRESLNQPLIIVFEDLHWLDAETQTFLSLLSESIPTARILLLVNYRPEYRHDWGNKSYYTQLRLDPLGREQAEEMLAALLGESVGATGRSPRHQFILDKTEGNPFFMEEIVQALREQGVLRPSVGAELRVGPQGAGAHPSTTLRTGSGAPLQAKSLVDLRLPTTVQGVLAARMDRLPPDEKALLQTLAVIGREFSSSLLKRVAEQPEAELYRQLSHLQAAEFIYGQPAFPDVEYIFKHALTQEVAYNSLLQERRKVLHERAARAIEEVHRAKLDDHYSALAHHYSRSGSTQKAVDYLHLAGQQAAQRSAHQEAITHLTTAIELLTTLPNSPTRTLQELMLQISLGATLMTPKGYTAIETKNAYTRAWELSKQIGESSQIGPILWALSLFYRVRGEHSLALHPHEQLLSIARRQQDPVLLLAGHTLLGSHFQWTGDLIAARTHLEEGMRFHDLQQQKLVWQSYGVDIGILCVTDLALVLWCCGYPDQALSKIYEALRLGQELAHPHSLVLARCWASWLYQLCRRDKQILQGTTDAITIATEQGLSFYSGILAVVHGWALAKQGNTEEGLAEIDQGLALYRAKVGEHDMPYFLALLAETQNDMGRNQEAEQSLTNALAIVEKNGERFYEAELYRLKGELTLRQQSKVESQKSKVFNPQSSTPNPQAEAEECFLKAIDIARKQQAKSWELRAATSLARLWREQGKRDEARTVLSEVYNWFTEGFDTKDLQEAKALLEELSHWAIEPLNH
jgi:class 3 adenylate cyclase/tetratricopeptide (TPR) repeat protein